MKSAIIYNRRESKAQHQVVVGVHAITQRWDGTVEFVTLFLIGKNAAVTEGLGIRDAHIDECSGAMQCKYVV